MTHWERLKLEHVRQGNVQVMVKVVSALEELKLILSISVLSAW